VCVRACVGECVASGPCVAYSSMMRNDIGEKHAALVPEPGDSGAAASVLFVALVVVLVALVMVLSFAVVVLVVVEPAVLAPT